MIVGALDLGEDVAVQRECRAYAWSGHRIEQTDARLGLAVPAAGHGYQVGQGPANPRLGSGGGAYVRQQLPVHSERASSSAGR